MEHDGSNGRGVWKVAAIALGMIALAACAYGFVIYSAFSTDLAAARIDGAHAHDEVVRLRTELNSTEAQANAMEEQLQSAQARLAARSRGQLPIQLSFHGAVLRSG